jgi:hypothetical protein
VWVRGLVQWWQPVLVLQWLQVLQRQLRLLQVL